MENIRSYLGRWFHPGGLRKGFLLAITEGAALLLVLVLNGATPLHAFTTVTLAPGTPENIETQFITATTNQFQATVLTNPFFPNTFQITIQATNPKYDPPVTQIQLLQEIDQMGAYEAMVDSNTYIFGFADGMTYQQTSEEAVVGHFGNLCNSPTSYNLIQTGTSTFDPATCADVIGTIDAQLFAMSLSTPPVIPPQP